MTTIYKIAIATFLVACNKDKDGDDKPVGGGNTTPVADAGEDQTFPATATADLNGCASYDPDGDPITFLWGLDHQPGASSLVDDKSLFAGNNTTACNSSFQPDVPGTYVVRLSVADNRGATSQPDFVVITVEGGDKPIADAGQDQEGLLGASFAMDGSGSLDPTGRDLSYAWEFVTLPTASSLKTLTGADTINPTFVADATGLYTVSLVVNNGILDSDPDTANITVGLPDATAPLADAGPDQTVEDCTPARLDGSGSTDEEAKTLVYNWALQTKPAGSGATNANIADQTAEITTFFPDVAGDYMLSLAVFDGDSWSVPDTTTLTVIERTYNSAPVVDAGADQTIAAGTAECSDSSYTGLECDECAAVVEGLGLDATATDADGDDMTHLWEVVSGDAEIANPTALSTKVTLEGVTPEAIDKCVEETYQFRLTSTDCPQESGTDTVTFTAICCGVEKPK